MTEKPNYTSTRSFSVIGMIEDVVIKRQYRSVT